MQRLAEIAATCQCLRNSASVVIFIIFRYCTLLSIVNNNTKMKPRANLLHLFRASFIFFIFHLAVVRVSAQVNFAMGMCNFDPCVKTPVPARCEIDVALVGVTRCVCPDGELPLIQSN